LPGHFAPHLDRLRAVGGAAERAGLSRLALCLRFVLAQPAIDRVIVGVTGMAELQQILAAATDVAPLPQGLAALASGDPRLVNPALCPRCPAMTAAPTLICGRMAAPASAAATSCAVSPWPAWSETGGRAAFCAAMLAPSLQQRLVEEGFGCIAVETDPGSAGDADATVAAAGASAPASSSSTATGSPASSTSGCVAPT